MIHGFKAQVTFGNHANPFWIARMGLLAMEAQDQAKRSL